MKENKDKNMSCRLALREFWLPRYWTWNHLDIQRVEDIPIEDSDKHAKYILR